MLPFYAFLFSKNELFIEALAKKKGKSTNLQFILLSIFLVVVVVLGGGICCCYY